jgi:DNA-directed RNA polymerase specialized sigma subunit, sigma24 homolog
MNKTSAAPLEMVPSEEDMMAAVDKVARVDLREKMTSSILEVLAHLPEAHKKIFIWKHYHGWQTEKIAARLSCNSADVEGILQQIDLNLLHRAGSLVL